MTKEELAARLNGREYMNEITTDEEARAKESGLCVVFGYSDDNLELRGAWSEEFGAFEGIVVQVDHDGPLINDCDDEDCPYFADKMRQAKDFVLAKRDNNGYAWWMESSLPYAPFDVMDEGALFCRGIVIEIPPKAPATSPWYCCGGGVIKVDTADFLERAALMQPTGQANELMIEAARAGVAEILKLRRLGRAVVDARHYNGDDGWDRLKNAIAELEGEVMRDRGKPYEVAGS